MQKLLALLDSCGGRLHALLAKMTDDRDAADELLQDLFLRILQTNRLADAPNPEGYLFRAAINLAFDWRKRTRRVPDVALLNDDATTDGLAPLDGLVKSERVEQVLAAMEQLSEDDRELISMRFLQDESPEWIAARWNSTPHQIRSRCSKAVARLRNLVEQDGTFENSLENQ
jgi:RNA polymerase sigma-70 factor (ECF subfamily)